MTAGEVAVALIGLVSRELDDHEDRKRVASDVVDRWPNSTPNPKRDTSRRVSLFSALARFTWDYVDTVEDGIPATPQDWTTQDETTQDETTQDETTQDDDNGTYLVWQDHARRLRAGRDAHVGPDAVAMR